MRQAAVFAAVLTIGCQKSAQQPSMHVQREALLNSIADRCGMPRDVFKLHGVDRLELNPAPDASEKGFECILTELQKANRPFKFGFIGNEYYFNEVR